MRRILLIIEIDVPENSIQGEVAAQRQLDAFRKACPEREHGVRLSRARPEDLIAFLPKNPFIPSIETH